MTRTKFQALEERLQWVTCVLATTIPAENATRFVNEVARDGLSVFVAANGEAVDFVHLVNRLFEEFELEMERQVQSESNRIATEMSFRTMVR